MDKYYVVSGLFVLYALVWGVAHYVHLILF